MSDPQMNILVAYVGVLALFTMFLLGFSSMMYAFRRFCSWRIVVASSRRQRNKARQAATKELDPSIISDDVAKTVKQEVEAPDFSLWEENPHHIGAIRHRTLRLGRKEHTKLVVSDYPDGKSIATLRTKTDRIRLCDKVVTGPSGDATLLAAAEEKLAA